MDELIEQIVLIDELMSKSHLELVYWNQVLTLISPPFEIGQWVVDRGGVVCQVVDQQMYKEKWEVMIRVDGYKEIGGWYYASYFGELVEK